MRETSIAVVGNAQRRQTQQHLLEKFLMCARQQLPRRPAASEKHIQSSLSHVGHEIFVNRDVLGLRVMSQL